MTSSPVPLNAHIHCAHQTPFLIFVTQDSWDSASLKCFPSWQMDQDFKNQSIPGINRKPRNRQSGVLGEKLWFQRSPSFQSSTDPQMMISRFRLKAPQPSAPEKTQAVKQSRVPESHLWFSIDVAATLGFQNPSSDLSPICFA